MVGNRLPLFKRSDLFSEFKLCKMLAAPGLLDPQQGGKSPRIFCSKAYTKYTCTFQNVFHDKGKIQQFASRVYPTFDFPHLPFASQSKTVVLYSTIMYFQHVLHDKSSSFANNQLSIPHLLWGYWFSALHYQKKLLFFFSPIHAQDLKPMLKVLARIRPLQAGHSLPLLQLH